MSNWWFDQANWKEKPELPRSGDHAYAFKDGKWVVLVYEVIPGSVPLPKPSVLLFPASQMPKPEPPKLRVRPVLMLNPDGRVTWFEEKC